LGVLLYTYPSPELNLYLTEAHGLQKLLILRPLLVASQVLVRLLLLPVQGWEQTREVTLVINSLQDRNRGGDSSYIGSSSNAGSASVAASSGLGDTNKGGYSRY